ncbi:MAG: hypothetical protein M3076_02885 [Actinomycetota bacterium]|nr:hypothetical protein [Actinomycetota bacterium]
MEREAQPGPAAYESVLREINEAIQRGQWPGEENEPVGFRCECGRLGCNELLELTTAAYQRIRKYSRRFLVAPGHEQPSVESVVAAGPGYVVVEKRGQAAAWAEETDPRR